jgi:hypothetical protein
MKDPKVIALFYERKTLGSFEMALMDLYGKADEQNKKDLALGFPEYYLAYMAWFHNDYKKDK